MPIEKNICKNCIFIFNNSKDSVACGLTSKIINPEGVACQFYQLRKPEAIAQCNKCGYNLPLSYAIVADADELLCNKCASMSGTCQMCESIGYCAFQESPIELKKEVEVRQQHGNGYIIQCIPNPERIKQTCMVECKCYSEEYGCGRQFNTCENYMKDKFNKEESL